MDYKRKKRLVSGTDEHTGDRLGFYVQSVQVSKFTVPIDEPVTEPAYYRDVVNLLDEASENDEVRFKVNSPGGNLNGLQSVLSGIASTKATTVAEIVGECHSAASLLVMHCDNVIVMPQATMLCHNVSYGTAGKGSDIVAYVDHVTKVSADLIRSAYTGFLTETEIEEMLAGKEFWFDSDEICIRLEARDELLKELNESTPED